MIKQAENTRNLTKRKRTISGYRGVAPSRNATDKPWRAYGTINGKQHVIGYFENVHEAGAAAKAWRVANMPGAVD